VDVFFRLFPNLAVGPVLPPFSWAAVVALTVHIAAYVAEIVPRAGIESIPPRPRCGRLALGMSRAEVVRKNHPAAGRGAPSAAFGSIRVDHLKDTAIREVSAVPNT